MGAVLETGFSGRNIPFYGLPSSRVFENEPTVSEALEMAGLNWEVGKRPLKRLMKDGTIVDAPGRFETYRLDTEAFLGDVGPQYTPFNNEPALALIDELLGHGCRIACAGAYHNSADVFISAHLPEGITVPGEEELDLYLLFRNNHSGMGSVSTYITPIRLACTNMLGAAIGNAVSSWKVRHTQTVSARVNEAAATLGLVDRYKDAMAGTIKQLQETEMELDELDKFLKELTDAERVQKTIKDVYTTSDTVTQGNRWGVFNAVTEALDWHPSRRTGVETRFASQLDGPIAHTRQRAMRLLTNR